MEGSIDGGTVRRGEAEEVDEVAARMQGRLMISVDEDEEKGAAVGFENAIVLKLETQRSFNKLAFMRTMSKVWNVKEGDFVELAGNIFLAKLKDEGEQRRVLEGGPWNFMNQLIITNKWKAGLAPFEYNFRRCGVWVQVHNLPPEYLVGEAAEMMAKKCAAIIGELKYFNVAVMNKRRVLRLRVEMDIRQPLCPGIMFDRKIRDPLQLAFKYERLPVFCFRCGMIGHEVKFCNLSSGPGTYEGELGPWMKAEVEGYGLKSGVEKVGEGCTGSGEQEGGGSDHQQSSDDNSRNMEMCAMAALAGNEIENRGDRCIDKSLEGGKSEEKGRGNEIVGDTEEPVKEPPLVVLRNEICAAKGVGFKQGLGTKMGLKGSIGLKTMKKKGIRAGKNKSMRYTVSKDEDNDEVREVISQIRIGSKKRMASADRDEERSYKFACIRREEPEGVVKRRGGMELEYEIESMATANDPVTLAVAAGRSRQQP